MSVLQMKPQGIKILMQRYLLNSVSGGTLVKHKMNICIIHTSLLVHLQAHHLRCLNDFVEAQTTYYAQCYQYMVDLQKQLGR